MALLGKLLLFFNLLAAAGLIYVATQDWARRQEITSTALQYYLSLDGLPLDAADGTTQESLAFPVPTSGGHVTETVSEGLVGTYFKGADGGGQYGAAGLAQPILTQMAEVKRVQDKLDAALRAAGEPDRLEVLCGRFRGTQFTPGILVRLAESFEERELVRELAKAGDPRAITANIERAEAILKRKFETALAKPNPRLAAEFADSLKAAAEKLRAAAGPRQAAEAPLLRAQASKDPAAIEAATRGVNAAEDGLKAAWKEFGDVLAGTDPAAARNEADRRQRVAHLLVFLDRAGEWQTRAVRVVGLMTYQRAIADQSSRLQEMALSVQRQTESDQASFVVRYEQLKTLAVERAALAQSQEGIRRNLAAQAVKDTEAANLRADELKQRQQLLDAVKADLTTRLAAQAEVERQLLEVQQQVGRTRQKNLDLYKQLGKAEDELGGK